MSNPSLQLKAVRHLQPISGKLAASLGLEPGTWLWSQHTHLPFNRRDKQAHILLCNYTCEFCAYGFLKYSSTVAEKRNCQVTELNMRCLLFSSQTYVLGSRSQSPSRSMVTDKMEMGEVTVFIKRFLL